MPGRKIRVHEKALAHLSRGLYRSPASALRELVTNAWDASARTVRINTNFPSFLQLSVEDDGDGFTREDFEKLMSGGIGNSRKRSDMEPLRFGRPTIGRLGIGMLGIAQLCGSFIVTSNPKAGSGFRARVRLYDLLKEQLDTKGSTLIEESPMTGIRQVDVGEYEFEDFDAKSIRRGTRLITDDLHPAFISAFRDSLKAPEYRQPPLEWSKAFKILGKIRSLQELGDYWRLLWELAAASPIPYVSARALPKGLARADQKRLTAFDFKLLVDSIELRKPIQLLRNPHGFSTWAIAPQEKMVYGKKLQFHGYVLVQEGSQLKPDELRGILIRIKDVGIGNYDPSLLDYRYNEGPRSRWVTGEIFVDEGLEDALNIDRDSFNRFHPQFRAIQTYVHELLHDTVFPAVYKEIDKRSDEMRETREAHRANALRTAVADVTGRRVAMRSSSEKSASPSNAPAVVVTAKANELRVAVPKDIKTKKSNQQLAKSVLAIFEIAMRQRSHGKQRDVFTRLLLELLNKW